MTRGKEIRDAAYKKYNGSGICEIAYIEGAEWADRNPHWISVEEELPPRDKIISDDGSEVESWNSILVLATTGKNDQMVLTRYDYMFSEWLFNSSYPNASKITHWMYKPRLPWNEEQPK